MELSFSMDDFLPREEKCLAILRHMRWHGKITCVHCKSQNINSNGTRRIFYHKYICRNCKKSFTETTGTVFENSKIPIREWIYIGKELKRGISINKINNELGRKYDHVHRIAKKIMNNAYEKRFLETLSGKVEIDEMYISAGEKGSKTLKRQPRKRGLKLRGRGTYDKDKPPIAGAVERKGKISLQVMKNMRKRSVNKIMKRVDKKSKVYTDDFTAYSSLKKKGYKHETVNHSEKEYARGDVHTNTIEGAFQGLRHFLDLFKGICKKNLHLYVSLYENIYNNRDKDATNYLNFFLKENVFTSVN
ncbi:MAG TPA: IS1595 family transposase [archaeon]|nr:IS1595 family transposase [archaeon]